jgi:hypothetical protein
MVWEALLETQRAQLSPKGIRRWRGTKAKLMICAGTQIFHSALQLSHTSFWYLVTAADIGFPSTAVFSAKKEGK